MTREQDNIGGDASERTEIMPWCPNCEAISVPTPRGNCGECGHDIKYKEGVE